MDNRYQRPNIVGYQQEPNPYPWMVPGAPIPPAIPSGSPYTYGTNYAPFVPTELHPLLREGSRAIQFNLSEFEFKPLDAKGKPIAFNTLTEPATYPPTTKLTIKAEQMPQWPMLLDYYAATLGTPHSAAGLPPITLGDVLYAIHETMQTQITHREWADLDEREGTAVGKAYVKRYKLAPGHETRIAAQGVKRVDYLLKKVWFAGLTRKSGDNGFDHLKLLVDSEHHWRW